MHKLLLSALLALTGLGATAKSLVVTLADTKGTRVYYRLGGDVNPRLVLMGDGTFQLCGREYTLLGVKNFYISADDFSGERNTEDAIIAISDDGPAAASGPTRVYTLDGRLVSTADGIHSLPAGTYVIKNGTRTLKVQKR